jgi:transglutaminase-like putative cysteine protease
MKLESRRCWLLILAFLVVLGTFSFAAIDPVKVSSMRVEVNQTVHVSTTGNVNTLTVNLMAPQEDAFQKVESVEVSVPYETTTDAYGNKMTKVTLNNPSSKAGFTVKTVLTVLRRNGAAVPNNPIFSQPTSLVESGDKDIINLAADTTAGSTSDFEKTAAIADWVNENIRYDLAYASVNLSAKTTLNNRAGVCDEFSALTMAMLRSIGYKAAYTVGYAYGRGYTIANDFVPHGWVETCSLGGNCYQVDSTWGEAGWLDASHIKFATLPESYYVEASASAKGTGQVEVALDSVDTKITILGSGETPLINTQLSLLKDGVWNGYAVTKTDLSTDGCIFTKVRFGGCLREQGTFLAPDSNETGVAFCNKKTVFMPYRIPGDMEGNSIYTCGLVSAPNGGEQKTIEVTLDPREKSSERPALGVDRTAVKPDETVTANAAGAQIFTSNGYYGTGSLSITAPAKDFIIYAYNNGQLAEQPISVANSRPIELKLTAPASVKLGETANVSIEVRNIDSKSRNVEITLGAETKSGVLDAGKAITYPFTFTPTGDEGIVQAFAESEGFSTSTSAPITVIRPDKNILDQIIEAITSFLDSLFGVH